MTVRKAAKEELRRSKSVGKRTALESDFELESKFEAVYYGTR